MFYMSAQSSCHKRCTLQSCYRRIGSDSRLLCPIYGNGSVRPLRHAPKSEVLTR